MIFDSLNHSENYALGPRFAKAFQFLSRLNDAPLHEGRYDIYGDTVFALISRYDTQDYVKVPWEAHSKFTDIHYVIQGSEDVFYSPTESLVIKQGYNKDEDYLLLDGRSLGRICLHKGMFIVLFPQDAHKPGCIYESRENILKVVVKIQV